MSAAMMLAVEACAPSCAGYMEHKPERQYAEKAK
jgi:hypothetical protein